MHYISYSLNGNYEMAYSEPASKFLRAAIVSYMKNKWFSPKYTLTKEQLHSLIDVKVKSATENVNLAFNVNDKTTKRR